LIPKEGTIDVGCECLTSLSLLSKDDEWISKKGPKFAAQLGISFTCTIPCSITKKKLLSTFVMELSISKFFIKQDVSRPVGFHGMLTPFSLG
jgi:hypothetical protein